MSRSTAFGLRGKCQHFVECVRSIPNFKFFGELSLPREPFRPRGLVSAEGIRLGPPPLARWLKGLRFCGGTGDEGWGRAALRSEPRRGRKHVWIFAVSSSRVEGLPGRRGWSAGPLALCLAWPWRGPVGPRPPAHSYLQALQRKTNDSLVSWVSSSFILNRVHSPCLSRGPCCCHGCVCVILLQLSCL